MRWVLMAVLKTIFLMPIRAQDKYAFSGVSSNWNPRFLICGSDINNGTSPSSTMSNSVNWVFHPWSYMNITSFSVHLDCCEFAKKNLELVGWISYQSPLLGCESTYLQNASTARREPIALVHPRSRIHTVGGAEFSVWKASPFSHARSVCTVWNEKALCCDGSSISVEHPYENKDVPFSNGFHEASPSWRPTCLGTQAGHRCTPCRRASTSPTRTGNLFISLLFWCAVASRWFCPPRRVRRCTSCCSYVDVKTSTRAGSVSPTSTRNGSVLPNEKKPWPELDAAEE